MTYLIFKIDNEIFAAPIEQVTEVLSEYSISPVPNSPEYIEGIINYRGDVIPAIDFHKKLLLTDIAKTAKQVVVFVIKNEENETLFGAIIDKVISVYETEEIKDRPEFGSKYNPEYIQGTITFNDDFVMVLNIPKIFSDTEIKLINDIQE